MIPRLVMNRSVSDPAFVSWVIGDPLISNREARNGPNRHSDSSIGPNRLPAYVTTLHSVAAETFGKLLSMGYDVQWNYICNLILQHGIGSTDKIIDIARNECPMIPKFSDDEGRQHLEAVDKHDKIVADTKLVKAETRKIELENAKLENENRLLEKGLDIKRLEQTIQQLGMEKEHAILLKNDIDILDAYGYLCAQTIGQQITNKHETTCANICRNYFAKSQITDNMMILHAIRIILAMYSVDRKFAMTSYFDWDAKGKDDFEKLKKKAEAEHKPWKVIKGITAVNKMRAGITTRSRFFGLFNKKYELTSF